MSFRDRVFQHFADRNPDFDSDDASLLIALASRPPGELNETPVASNNQRTCEFVTLIGCSLQSFPLPWPAFCRPNACFLVAPRQFHMRDSGPATRPDSEVKSHSNP